MVDFQHFRATARRTGRVRSKKRIANGRPLRRTRELVPVIRRVAAQQPAIGESQCVPICPLRIEADYSNLPAAHASKLCSSVVSFVFSSASASAKAVSLAALSAVACANDWLFAVLSAPADAATSTAVESVKVVLNLLG